MIWAALGFTLIANVNLAVALVLAYRERKQLIAAMLQANGKVDAARRLTHAEEHTKAKEAIKMQKEIMENGGAFSANNPFGNTKPVGI